MSSELSELDKAVLAAADDAAAVQAVRDIWKGVVKDYRQTQHGNGNLRRLLLAAGFKDGDGARLAQLNTTDIVKIIYRIRESATHESRTTAHAKR